MAEETLDISQYPDLTIDEIDKFLVDINKLKSDPKKLDKLYLSTLFITKIFPNIKNVSLIFRFFKYHIFELHPKLEARIQKLEEEIVNLKLVNDQQQNQINNLSSQQTSLSQTTSSITSTVNSNNSNLSNSISEINRNISNLSNQIGQNTQLIQNINSRISTINSEISTLESYHQ